MSTLAPRFNTHRMVQQYAEKLYLPRFQVSQAMTRDGFAGTAALVNWDRMLDHVWHEVKILDVDICDGDVEVGSRTDILARVMLGRLRPQDVSVQLVLRHAGQRGKHPRRPISRHVRAKRKRRRHPYFHG